VKTDSNGTEAWNKTFGGTDYDWAKSVQQTKDDYFILAGGTESYGDGRQDVWLLKTDSNGNEQWNKTFGRGGFESSMSVQQTEDGGYILAGDTTSYGSGSNDFWLLKIDCNGTEQWNQTFGGTDTDFAFSVQQTVDGGYILAGYTGWIPEGFKYSYGTGDSDFWLIKVKEEEPTIPIFDTEPSENPYPSIMGTHNGSITLSHNITVSTLYTYACVGTGGHTESIELYDENSTLIANGSWDGYIGDYHNITIHNLTGGARYVTLLKGHKYNYTIITGSYPQILHEPSKDVTGGTITCDQFIDANGKTYTDWIPAIRLWM
jgi:predicted secreted protein